MYKSGTINLRIEDMTGQREFVASDVPCDASWGETLSSILARMSLPPNDPASADTWRGHLDREGRGLHTSEIIGDAMVEGDKVVLQKEVNAGARGHCGVRL